MIELITAGPNSPAWLPDSSVSTTFCCVTISIGGRFFTTGVSNKTVFLSNPPPRASWMRRTPTIPLCAAPEAVCALNSGMCSKGCHDSKINSLQLHYSSVPLISESTLTAVRKALTGNNIYLMKYLTPSPQDEPFRSVNLLWSKHLIFQTQASGEHINIAVSLQPG